MSMMLTLLAEHSHLAQVEINPVAPPGSDKWLWLAGIIKWFCILAGVLGICVAGALFAWEKWSTGAVEAPKKLVGGMVGGVIVATSSALIGAATGV
ncbi:hypothetical protein ACFVVM_32895 [Nocardia sp. NPDC058176]|uniref:hypothetical protein n=1 Tax=Nocardia sp. NPDC058176 TaxID=3346368 RepID=UPI0036D9B5C3